MDHQHKVFIIGGILLVSWFISYQLFFAAELPEDDYEPGLPIEINGEADWDNYPGIITGSGTEFDPYLIEGLEITEEAGASISIRDTTSYVTIRSNHLRNSIGDGIYLENVKNAEITLNIIDFCGRDGIRLENTQNNHWMRNILIYNNSLIWNLNNGISLINAIWSWYGQPSSSNNIGSSQSGGGGGGGNAVMQDILIENNTISHNQQYGIYIQGLQVNLIIQFNTISYNTYSGIEINQAYHNGDNKIRFNNILYNLDGIVAVVMRYFEIFGNTFNNTGYGVRGAYVNPFSNYNTYLFNKFYDLTSPQWLGDELPGNAELDNGLFGNYWSNYSGTDNDGDGIGDIPHNLTTLQGTHMDHYPIVSLTKPLPFNLTSDADTPDPDRSFTLSWTKSYNALSYSIYRHSSFITEINGSIDLVASGLTNNSYVINDIPMGEYFFVVFAKNSIENATSNNIFIIAGQYPQPFTLTSDAENPDDGYFTLSWTESLFASYYNVYSHYSPITEINSSIDTLVSGSTGFSLSINGLSDGNYFFVVEAENVLGKRLSNNHNVIVGDKPTPFNLSSNADHPDGDGNYTLTWTISENADNYSLYEFDKPITQINSSLTKVLNETNLRYHSFEEKENGTYYYIVVAHNELANTSSNCINVSVGRLPSKFILTTNATDPDIDGNYHLNWTTSIYAKNYSLYEYSTPIVDLDGLTPIAEGLTNLSYVFYAKPDDIFYYVVVAHNIYGQTMSNCIMVNSGGLPKPFQLIVDATDPDEDGNYTLNWTTSINAQNYTLYEHTAPITIITSELTKLVIESQSFSHYISNKSSGNYYYIVLAKNILGNHTSNSVNVSITRKPQLFSLFSDATDPDKDGTFSIFWTKSTFAKNYSVLLYDNGSFQIIDIVNASPYIFTNLEEGHYNFIIKATNEYGSTFSNGLYIIVDYPDTDDEDDEGDEKPSGLTPEQWIYIGIAAGISIPAIIGVIYYAKKK